MSQGEKSHAKSRGGRIRNQRQDMNVPMPVTTDQFEEEYLGYVNKRVTTAKRKNKDVADELEFERSKQTVEKKTRTILNVEENKKLFKTDGAEVDSVLDKEMIYIDCIKVDNTINRKTHHGQDTSQECNITEKQIATQTGSVSNTSKRTIENKSMNSDRHVEEMQRQQRLRHMPLLLDQTEHQCMFCPSKCKTRLLFIEHLKQEIHLRNMCQDFMPGQIPPEDIIKKLTDRGVHNWHDVDISKCGKCGHVFLNKVNLFRHLCECRLKCETPWCTQTFVTQEEMNKHIGFYHKQSELKSSRKKMFLCMICKTIFQDRRELGSHVKIHKKEEFKCCDQQFADFKNYVHHKVKMHSETENWSIVLCQSDDCGSVFFTETEYAIHVSENHPLKVFTCAGKQRNCRQYFLSDEAWDRHFHQHACELFCTQCEAKLFNKRCWKRQKMPHINMKTGLACKNVNTFLSILKKNSQDEGAIHPCSVSGSQQDMLTNRIPDVNNMDNSVENNDILVNDILKEQEKKNVFKKIRVNIELGEDAYVLSIQEVDDGQTKATPFCCKIVFENKQTTPENTDVPASNIYPIPATGPAKTCGKRRTKCKQACTCIPCCVNETQKRNRVCDAPKGDEKKDSDEPVENTSTYAIFLDEQLPPDEYCQSQKGARLESITTQNTNTVSSKTQITNKESSKTHKSNTESIKAQDTFTESSKTQNSNTKNSKTQNTNTESRKTEITCTESGITQNASTEISETRNGGTEVINIHNTSTESIKTQNTYTESSSTPTTSTESIKAYYTITKRITTQNASAESCKIQNTHTESSKTHDTSTESGKTPIFGAELNFIRPMSHVFASIFVCNVDGCGYIAKVGMSDTFPYDVKSHSSNHESLFRSSVCVANKSCHNYFVCAVCDSTFDSLHLYDRHACKEKTDETMLCQKISTYSRFSNENVNAFDAYNEQTGKCLICDKIAADIPVHIKNCHPVICVYEYWKCTVFGQIQYLLFRPDMSNQFTVKEILLTIGKFGTSHCKPNLCFIVIFKINVLQSSRQNILSLALTVCPMCLKSFSRAEHLPHMFTHFEPKEDVTCSVTFPALISEGHNAGMPADVATMGANYIKGVDKPSVFPAVVYFRSNNLNPNKNAELPGNRAKIGDDVTSINSTQVSEKRYMVGDVDYPSRTFLKEELLVNDTEYGNFSVQVYQVDDQSKDEDKMSLMGTIEDTIT
ncbi:uncharacterized protein LOC127847446 [Dreissena polymorpha]|uniref:C2H2-type domain-containing protein n=1 Tax=Dreissena polymorpha TaxID=45954 RepID=A0A9D4DJW9_DREPO|nr:uncharacterized protein LOC127847446 [Dreissena polymorpha]KAH3751007.1 hypothetical protein DPMN_185548 [Dreissena polymorpha]